MKKIKITLLGDSIRKIGYGTHLPELLGEGYEVYQPDTNGRFSKNTLRDLFDYEKDMQGTRIVHWNNGLWDTSNIFGDGCFTSEQEYVDNMLRIADILLKRYGKVIFATTTPVTLQNEFNENCDIRRYNELIVPLLKEKGIIINDLYSIVNSDIDRYIRKDDNVHLTDAGIEICANQVADMIRKASETLEEIDDSSLYYDIDHNGAPV